MASNEIAQEKGEKFANFERSAYADGSYFDKYLTRTGGQSPHAVKELFAGFFIPTPDDWQELKQRVQESGLYNAYRLAVAPNGSTSYIGDSTV